MTPKPYTLEQFTAEAERFTRTLAPSDEHAIVLALHGDLGAGKTTFTQVLARTLGVSEAVASPTFVIQKTYPLRTPTSKSAWKQLIHIDAYRLEGAHEIKVLGWSEIYSDPRNLIVLEWPENIKDALPKYVQHIHFSYIDQETRGIAYE